MARPLMLMDVDQIATVMPTHGRGRQASWSSPPSSWKQAQIVTIIGPTHTRFSRQPFVAWPHTRSLLQAAIFIMPPPP